MSPRKLLCLPNKPGLLDSSQLHAYALGGFDGAKLMPEHSPDNVAQLERAHPGGLYVARCQSATQNKPGNPWYSYQELGQLWYDQIASLYPLGVTTYQLDTEPNNDHPVSQAFDWQWLIGMAIGEVRSKLTHLWTSQGYSKDVIALLHRRLQLYLGPLADGPGHWTEIEQVGGWWDACEYLLKQPGLLQGLCVDGYFQYAKHAVDEGFAANAARFHRWAPNYKVLVAEWGCSLVDKYPVEERQHPSPAQLQEIETEDLAGSPAFLNWARAQDYILATCRFICPGSAGWPGFEPSQRVLQAIGGANP